MKPNMRVFLYLLTLIPLTAAPKIAIMETAFGHRCAVESITLTRMAGYDGVQLHTGVLDKEGRMTISDPELQQALLKASAEHEVEIMSLCAGSMNKLTIWKAGDSRDQGLAVITQSLAACEAFDCDLLLFPFFGPSNFQESDEVIQGVAQFIQEILPIARKHGVTLGIESPVTYDRVLKLFELLDHPKDVQMYYDTGNMLRRDEDINQALRTLTGSRVCEIHLKPKEGIIFGQGGTDLEKLAATLDHISYDQWLVFEQGGKVEKGDTTIAIESMKGIKQLLKLRKTPPVKTD